MDHLQSDIESLETEKGELREKLKALNKKTLYEALSKSSPLTGMFNYRLQFCLCKIMWLGSFVGIECAGNFG